MARYNNTQVAERAIDALRLTDEEWRRLADKLDREAATSTKVADRKFERVPYRNMVRVLVDVDHPGGNRIRYVVRTRDISRSGISFFHGQYLHPGSLCSCFLAGHQSGPQRLIGVVVRCEHLEDQVHEIGVEFREPIDPSDFLLYTQT